MVADIFGSTGAVCVKMRDLYQQIRCLSAGAALNSHKSIAYIGSLTAVCTQCDERVLDEEERAILILASVAPSRSASVLPFMSTGAGGVGG